MTDGPWVIHNPSGGKRVIVTKELPGDRWLAILKQVDCRVEVCTSTDNVSGSEIKAAFGDNCAGAIGQLTEDWNADLLSALRAAGGRVYSNYAVGFNNVDLATATAMGIPVGNTPGVLTEATAELAVVLALAAARRVVEGDRMMRAGEYKGWLPSLLLGKLLGGKTVGVIGAGRIGAAFARIMVEGFKMNLVYFDIHPNERLERYVTAYADLLRAQGEDPVTVRRASLEDVLKEGDVVSLHPVLDPSTHHLIDAKRLKLMKDDAILVNASRGPVIDEAALVFHLQQHPRFQAALDVYDEEPAMAPGLAELDNVVLLPHLGSATEWTRQAMAVLAASNVAGILAGFRVWNKEDVTPFLGDKPPRAAPSIVNAAELHLPAYQP